MNISLSLTALFFYFAIFVTILLSALVIRRLWLSAARENEKLGCFTVGYVTLVIASLCLLFFPFLAGLIQATVSYATYPRYEAIVIDVESEWEEHTYTDSDGDSYTEDVLMHTAIVEFTDDSGESIQERNSIQSGGEPVIGDIIIVSYKDGELLEFSFRAIALNLGLAFMLSILGYCLLLIFNYGIGRSNDRLILLGTWMGIHMIIPAAMLLMLSGMAYALLQYFLGYKQDMPAVIVAVLMFFCVTLFFAFVGYFKAIVMSKK